MRVTPDGRGIVNLLAADKLMHSPRLYATFLLWLLAELFEELPEAGDLAKPKLVFFFDEAHLLFDDAPKALVDKVEQVVRLIRSKGVGVYFITQNPLDIPEEVLGQLGNRVQHALRAFTPRDQRAVKAAAETFRANPDFNAATAIQELAVGEALVSLLEDKGIPGIVQRVMMAPPGSRLGPVTARSGRRCWGRARSAGATTIRWTGSRPMSICATGRKSRRWKLRLRGIPGRRRVQAGPRSATAARRGAAPECGGGDGQQRAAQPWNAVGPADRAGYPGRHHEALTGTPVGASGGQERN